MLPLRYSFRNVAVRRTSAALTVLGIALTVAVFAGVIALRDGFASVFDVGGDEDVVVLMRPGASSEGESVIRRHVGETVIKERSEFARDASGRPLAAMETFLAVYMETTKGGLTNVPLRGIQPMSLRLYEDAGAELVDGRWLEFGTDEVVVGEPLTDRMEGARIGDELVINLTPFKVVGVFRHPGSQNGEVWGDVERMMEALDREFFQRIYARVQPGADVQALAEELEAHPVTPLKLQTETDYLQAQTTLLSLTLQFLAGFLTLIMGALAILTAMNTMLASVGARTHEIGVLLAVGYGRGSVFLTFLLEAAAIGLLGGALGVLLVLPFDGLETGLMNHDTFTDVSFAFQVTPRSVLVSFALAFFLGVLGGTLPAWRAARLSPVEALRSA